MPATENSFLKRLYDVLREHPNAKPSGDEDASHSYSLNIGGHWIIVGRHGTKDEFTSDIVTEGEFASREAAANAGNRSR